MKKALIVALMMLAGIAQSAEINLKCYYSQTGGTPVPFTFTFDPTTNKGVIGRLPVSVDTSANEYILSHKTDRWYINRSSLAITITSDIFGKNTGQCEILQTQNKI